MKESSDEQIIKGKEEEGEKLNNIKKSQTNALLIQRKNASNLKIVIRMTVF